MMIVRCYDYEQKKWANWKNVLFKYIALFINMIKL
jgi:hypothetical protein